MSKGWKGFEEAVIKLEQNMTDPRFVEEAGEFVLSAAKMMCSGFQITSGELRNSLGMTVRMDLRGTEAHVGTNKEYAPFVEFGTGPKGARSHAGTAPDAGIVYSLSPWWIHESQVERSVAEIYHWFHIDTDQGRFYRVSGQPAHPYLYPAFEDNKKAITQILAKGMEEAFGR